MITFFDDVVRFFTTFRKPDCWFRPHFYGSPAIGEGGKMYMACQRCGFRRYIES